MMVLRRSILLVGLIVAISVVKADHSEEDDRYSPLIRLLKQLRRRDRYQNYYVKADTAAPVLTAAPLPVIADKPLVEPVVDTKIYNSNSFSNPDQIKKIVAQSQPGQIQPQVSTLPVAVGSGALSPLDYDLPPSGVTKIPPQRIDQINRGVSTILGGVRNASLNDILRGSFMFTRNENVRTVANNVLDAIFGRRAK